MHPLNDTVSWYDPIASLYRQRCLSHSDISEHMPRLKIFVERLKPRHIIELGVSTGNSTLSFLVGMMSLKKCLLQSVDIEPVHGELGEWIGKIPDWRFYQANDLPFHWNLSPVANIIFIDTEHNYSQTIREINEYAPHLLRTGVMLFHDTDSSTGFTVAKAMLEFAQKWGWLCYFWPNNNGLGVMYRSKYAEQIGKVIAAINREVKEGVT